MIAILQPHPLSPPREGPWQGPWGNALDAIRVGGAGGENENMKRSGLRAGVWSST